MKTYTMRFNADTEGAQEMYLMIAEQEEAGIMHVRQIFLAGDDYLVVFEYV